MEALNTWKITSADENSLILLQALFKTVYGTELSIEHLRWRFLSNPLTPTALILAYDASRHRLAGCCMASPVRISIDGRMAEGAQIGDVMTHPEYRKQGVFSTLLRECYRSLTEQGCKIAYAFPNHNSFPNFIRRMHWHFLGEIPLWVRLFPRDIFLTSKRMSNIRETMPESNSLKTFLESLPVEKKGCMIVRDINWLLWRYDQASERNYQWISLYDGAKLTGFAIWRKQKHYAMLAEIWALYPKDYPLLLASVIRGARSVKSMMIGAFFLRPELNVYLWRSGFIRVPNVIRRMKFVVSNVMSGEHNENIQCKNIWRITGGDIDTV